MDNKGLIGRISGREVQCLSCANEFFGVPLYDVNVYPYKQTCHKCGKVIMQGKTEGWCELFPPEQYAEEVIPIFVSVVDEANREFVNFEGGNSETWVNECFLPKLERAGLKFVIDCEDLSQELVSVVRSIDQIPKCNDEFNWATEYFLPELSKSGFQLAAR